MVSPSVYELSQKIFFDQPLLVNFYSSPVKLSIMQSIIDGLTDKEKACAKTLYKYNINTLYESLNLLKTNNPLLSLSMSTWYPSISFILDLIDKTKNVEKKLKMYIFWQILNNLMYTYHNPFTESLYGSLETHLYIDFHEQNDIFLEEILPHLKKINTDLLSNFVFSEGIERFFNPEKFKTTAVFLKSLPKLSEINTSQSTIKHSIKPNEKSPIKVTMSGTPTPYIHKSIDNVKPSVYITLRQVISLYDIHKLNEKDLTFIQSSLTANSFTRRSYFYSMLRHTIDAIYYNFDIEPFHLIFNPSVSKKVNFTEEYDYFDSYITPYVMRYFKTKSLEETLNIFHQIVYSTAVKKAFD